MRVGDLALAGSPGTDGDVALSAPTRPVLVDLTLAAQTVSTIAEVRWRQRVRVRGTVRKLRIEPWDSGIVTLECHLVDETGRLVVAFVGRRRVAGIQLGRSLEVEGTVIESRGNLAIMNPAYTFLPED